jgi:hypothetical protein
MLAAQRKENLKTHRRNQTNKMSAPDEERTRLIAQYKAKLNEHVEADAAYVFQKCLFLVFWSKIFFLRASAKMWMCSDLMGLCLLC